MPELKSVSAICKKFSVRSYYPEPSGMVGVRKGLYYHWFRKDAKGVFRQQSTSRLIRSGARLMVIGEKK